MPRLIGLLMSLAMPALAVEPHRSAPGLAASNGHGALYYDVARGRLTGFLEHPYRFARAGVQTRNLLWDIYPGLRVGASGTWLTDVAPSAVAYVPGTGVISSVREHAGLRVEEYDFMPMSLGENAFLMLLHVERTGGAGPVSAYALVNLHLGAGNPPGTAGEGLQYNAPRDAFYEYGPAGVAVGYGSVAPSAHHTAPPGNPFAQLRAGRDLDDANGQDGVDDAVGGFQADLGELAVGQEAWVGWYVVQSPDGHAQEAVDRVKSWLDGRGPRQLLDAELAAWSAWLTPPPATASADEAAVARQSQVVLRMAQVREAGNAHGQLLASLPPGQWNIAWVRDMAYGTVALARTGHLAEAKDALAFQLRATAGTYRPQVGGDYRLSVCRYFGEGVEESDVNEDGPNVEFDGFGLFLWALDEYVKAGGDGLEAWWPAVRDGVANVLVRLQGPDGLVAADSSIWEAHWNGRQQHFAFTTIAAAKGLWAASHLAQVAGDAAHSQGYRAAAAKARDAVATALRRSDGVLVQSTEALAANSRMLDAAVLEALNFGLFEPGRHTAQRTLDALVGTLTPPSGHGLFRNEWGGWYDQQEWIFLDLRLARALETSGRTDAATRLLAWNTAQATQNYGLLAELHDRDKADYAGAIPMVGFGAGAYLLALDERGKPVEPVAGKFADEPNAPPSLVVNLPAQADDQGPAAIDVVVADPDDGDLQLGVVVTLSLQGQPDQTAVATLEPGGKTARAPFSFPTMQAGTYRVRAAATDAAGATTTALATLTVLKTGTGAAGCRCTTVPGPLAVLALVLRRRRVRPLC